MSDQNKALPRVTQDSLLNVAIQVWELFLEDQGRSPYTVKAFTGDLSILAQFFPPDKKVGSVTTNEINQFLDWLQKGRGKPCSPKTLARRITSIKSFFRWLRSYGAIVADPAEKVVQKSVISPLPTVLSPEEHALVMEAANAYRMDNKPDARPYCLLALLLATSIKKGECREIDINHLDIENTEDPGVFIRYANPSYRYKERRIPLPNDWIEAYHEYTAQYNPQDKLFPWSPRRLEYILEDIGERAGISKHLSFDMCRWSSALHDWQEEMDPETLRIKLGVSKIQFRELKLKLTRLAAKANQTDRSTDSVNS